MDTTLIFGICGILGGLCTATGDMLLDIKGPDNKKLGKYGIMDSVWDRMDVRRFVWSILVAAVGVPLIFLGMTALAGQLMAGNALFGKIFWFVSMAGCCGAFFIHAFICLLPIAYKTMGDRYSFEEKERLIDTLYEAVKLPFWIFYSLEVFVPTIMVIWALIAGYLGLSAWYICLTLPVMMGVGLILAKIKWEWFCDLPHTITPSLSLSMMGLLAVLSHLAG